jgi:hypothetical protein
MAASKPIMVTDTPAFDKAPLIDVHKPIESRSVNVLSVAYYSNDEW